MPTMAHFAVLTRHGIRVVHRLRVETGNLPVSEIRMQAGMGAGRWLVRLLE
jgi:hypothetical protein